MAARYFMLRCNYETIVGLTLLRKVIRAEGSR